MAHTSGGGGGKTGGNQPEWWVVQEPWPTVHPTGMAEFPFHGTRDSASIQYIIIAGPYSTKAKALAYMRGVKPPAGSTVTQYSASPQSQAAVPVPSVPSVADFLSRLSQASTWVRVAKVVAGGALLIIGLAHMTGADNKVAALARNVPVPV